MSDLNPKSTAILWIGILMIAAGLVKDWATIRKTLFKTPASSANSNSSGSGPCPKGMMRDANTGKCIKVTLN